MKYNHAILTAAMFAFAVCACAEGQKKAKNAILFIGDGMGPAVVAAAATSVGGQMPDADGMPAKLSFEKFPVFGYMTTHSGNSFITDSAAAGTAMACGVKTQNGAIGVDLNGTPQNSVAKCAADEGKSAGVVTSVFLNDATPSVFYAHDASRKSLDNIVNQAFDKPFLKVLMGGAVGLTTATTTEQIDEKATAAGFTVVKDKEKLAAIDAKSLAENGRLFGYFDLNKNRMLDFESSRTAECKEPHLGELASKALDVVSQNDKGFFLMVEAGNIDWASHDGNDKAAIIETVQLSNVVDQTVKTLKEKGMLDDTLIVVTADHDTGGFTLNNGYGKVVKAGTYVTMQHNTNGHTAMPVYVWAMGPGAEQFNGKGDNTGICKKIKKALLDK